MTLLRFALVFLLNSGTVLANGNELSDLMQGKTVTDHDKLITGPQTILQGGSFQDLATKEREYMELTL